MPISDYDCITKDIETNLRITEPMIKHLKELIEFDNNGNVKGPSTDWDEAIKELKDLNKNIIKCYYHPEDFRDFDFEDEILLDETPFLIYILSNKELSKKIMEISNDIHSRYNEARKIVETKEGHMKLHGLVIDLILCIPKKYFYKKIIALEIIKRSKNISKEVKDELTNNFDNYYLSPVYTKTYLENADFDYSKEVSEELLKNMTEEFDGYF